MPFLYIILASTRAHYNIPDRYNRYPRGIMGALRRRWILRFTSCASRRLQIDLSRDFSMETETDWESMSVHYRNIFLSHHVANLFFTPLSNCNFIRRWILRLQLIENKCWITFDCQWHQGVKLRDFWCV